MNILIVAATRNEVLPLTDRLQLPLSSTPIQHYSFKHHCITVLITGVGMVATTYNLTKSLLSKNYNLALNIGLGGAFNLNLQVGQVVNVTSELFSELGAQNDEEFLTLHELELLERSEPPFINGKLINANVFHAPSLQHVQQVSAITVNTVHGHQATIEKTFRKFAPDIESMEGAAFAYVCLMNGLPFIQLRAISNYVEKRDKTKWNIPLALNNLAETTENLLKELN